MPYTKEQSKKEISKLIEKYERINAEGKIKQYNEEMTKKDFILPLFEALGWDVYNKKADEVTAEEKASKGRVDYAFRINGMPKLFVEAKSLKVDLDLPKWANQAINYAWYKTVFWAVLTDFEGIKVFNAEVKSTYPLQCMLFSLSYRQYLERFDQLWLLSRESLEQGLLDKEAEKWGKKLRKVPVDKQLLDDFTRWRELLSKDILKLNPDKHLTEEDLDESVQRILDRLIFIRSCEDRELEPKVLMSDLREWADKGKGALVKRVRERFVYFNDTYDSELFRKHLCDDLEINDEVLSDIIYGLHKTKDMGIPYDFSAIDADVLGTIYEQYLGHLLKKTPKRAKLEAKKAHRKEQGIYYTPTYIVDYIVRNTLGELLKDKKLDVENIKILDPACGSGSFLIKSFDVLNEYWSKKNKYDQTELDTETGAPFTRKVKILKNNIFGVDLDPKAVEIARLNLLLKIAEKKQRLPLLQESIKCGNSLIDDPDVAGDRAFKWEEEFSEIMEEGGFDVVIGNPPYIDSEEMTRTQPELREAYSKIYSTSKGNWDIFCIFIEKGLKLLKNGGFFGMIVPNKLLSADYAIEIRKLLQKYKIIAIRDYSTISVFQASVYPIVIIIQKETPRKNKFSAELMGVDNDSTKTIFSKKIEQEYLKKTPQNTWAYIFEESGEKIIDKILSNSSFLSELADVSGAATVSEAYELKELIEELSNQKIYFKFINTGTIDRYSSLWDFRKTGYIKASYKRPIILKENLKKFSNKRYEEALQSKIIIAGMVKRLECFLDFGNYLAGKSTTIVTSNKIDLKLILATLNSKLMTFVYANLFKSLSLSGGYMRVGPPQIRSLPIKQIPESQKSSFIKLVDEMLSLNKRLNELKDKRTDEKYKIEEEIRKTDAEIDKLVYELYGLTDEEITVVEETST
ncbi:MAG: N-6 DNA methylase [Methanocellales archaeon]|nr:N-6 DNA methylase [Methanocellales archaeon]MDD3291073.1 N-6 DNA methylase [Methanocellales archaeon]MDD5234958.1 N-6 DNA methylase [Methanocellales archaeon]MDD5484671.1 N-6 DNA methylase [Methanocellales archaeon]